jgi:hypothetical protein
VRYRLMATYRGSPFEAGIGPTDGEIVLFAACPPPEDLGFEPATGHWRKQLRIDEVQAVWESKPIGTFRGDRCMVLDDLGDRLHIGYLGHDGYQAERLGYWQVDRGVFELVAARAEVTDILEERTEYPRQRGTESTAPGRSAAQADYPPPGSPQDQARYLPADGPQDQASYLLDRPGYFQTQADYQAPASSGYQLQSAGAADWPDRAEADWPDRAEAGWPDRAEADRYAPGPVLDRGAPLGSGPAAADPASGISLPPAAAPAYPAADPASGITMPPAAEPPLPLEAAALRAATASRPRPAATQRYPDDHGRDLAPPVPEPDPPGLPAATPARSRTARAATAPAASVQTTSGRATAGQAPGQAAGPVAGERAGAAAPTVGHGAQAARTRRSARRRLATERLFAELASLAGIPLDAYAIGEEVEGALCLLQTEQGYEVFHSANGNRHELQHFASEEAACFYLFGVLAADGVRKGALQPAGGHTTGQLPVIRTTR